MNKLFLRSALFIGAAAAMFYLYGCSCNCGAPDAADIPSDVIRNAEEFIMQQTGRDFLEKYIKLDLNRSRVNEAGYGMVYRLIIPEKPFVNEVIEFEVDKAGKHIEGTAAKGIPGCLAGTGECDFNIDEVMAVTAADNAGLNEGIKPWETSFMWDENYGRYVWHVLSTFNENTSDGNFNGSGKTAVVDASSGKIIEIKDWVVK